MKRPVSAIGDLASAAELDHEAVLLVSRDATIRSHNDVLPRILERDEATLVGCKLHDLLADREEALRFERLFLSDTTPSSVSITAGLRTVGEGAVRIQFRAFPISGFRAPEDGFVLIGRVPDASGRLQFDVQSLALFPQEDPNPVLRISERGVLEYANKGSWMLLAHWGTEIGGQVPLSWIETVREAVESGDIREVEMGFKTIHLVVVPIPEKGYVNLYGLDITRRRHVERKLRLDAQVFENAMEAIMICDPDLRIIDVNRAFCRITAYSREEILGEHASVLYSGRHELSFYRGVWGTARRTGSWQGEVWDRRRNGSVYPKWLSVSAVYDESHAVTRFISIFSDITALKQSEEQLFHMAHYDSLTGLANRRYFLELLEKALGGCARSGGLAAVMFIDLDGFKLVNDTLGHSSGDELLHTVAVRIREAVRATDTVARIGGDEFTVILPDLKDAQNAAVLARKILGRIAEPYEIDLREMLVTPSIGIALYPGDAGDADQLLQRADSAMYRAKESGRNQYQFYSEDMNRRAKERLELLAKMRRGLNRDEFIVHYQPQVRLADGSVSGLEALVRWNCPGRGLLSPNVFIQAAEEHGMIAEIGEVVLRSVCRQLAIWKRSGTPVVKVAVNLSGYQLKQPGFVSGVEALLGESGVPGSMLELELTERVLVEDDTDTLRILESLKSLGATLTIDDFGTKYSSLAYLKQFPIDRLKIDRSFVDELSRRKSTSTIASVIIAMGRSLGMDVVAEGVECAEVAVSLRELGCPHAQGFYFGEPAGISATTEILRNQDEKRADA